MRPIASSLPSVESVALAYVLAASIACGGAPANDALPERQPGMGADPAPRLDDGAMDGGGPVAAPGATPGAAPGDDGGTGGARSFAEITSFEVIAHPEVDRSELQCNTTGTCFRTTFSPGGAISALAAGATALTTVADTTAFTTPIGGGFFAGLVVAGSDLYTNLCAGGVYKLPAGQTTCVAAGAVPVGQGGSCYANTLARDGGGTLYVSSPQSPGVLKLPVGATVWAATGGGLSSDASVVVPRGQDVYASDAVGLKVLAAGASSWAMVGTGNLAMAKSFTYDAAGNLLDANDTGLMRLAAGDTVWTRPAGLVPLAGNHVTHHVIDAAGAAYIVARVVAGGPYTLFTLPPGAAAWTRVVDLPAVITPAEHCLAMASDNVGHLVIDCGRHTLRSKP